MRPETQAMLNAVHKFRIKDRKMYNALFDEVLDNEAFDADYDEYSKIIERREGEILNDPVYVRLQNEAAKASEAAYIKAGLKGPYDIEDDHGVAQNPTRNAYIPGAMYGAGVGAVGGVLAAKAMQIANSKVGQKTLDRVGLGSVLAGTALGAVAMNRYANKDKIRAQKRLDALGVEIGEFNGTN